MENRINIHPQDFNSVYDYIDALGILEYGSNEDIQNAKSLYWKNYRKRYKKEEFASKNKSVSISFKVDEYHRIKSEAQSFKLPMSRYLKELIYQKGSGNTSELEIFLLDLIVELEDEQVSPKLIIGRLEMLLQKLQE